MATPTFILPSAPTYTEGFVNGLNVYPNPTNFVANQVPFTRATTATRTNAAGLIELTPYNLLQYSEQFDNATWSKTGATITANSIISPSGVQNADTITQSDATINIFQSINIVSTGNYTYSVYLKKGNFNSSSPFRFGVFRGTDLGYITFNFATNTTSVISGTFVSHSATSVGNDWYLIQYTINIPTTGNANFYNGGVGGNIGVGNFFYSWGAQLVEGTDALPYQLTETRLNRPRVDFSLGGCPNLLLEPQRTNLALFSEQFDNPTWNRGFSSVTANSNTSPSGIANADTLTADGTSASHVVSQMISFTTGTSYAATFYVKKSTNNFVQIYSFNVTGGQFANFDVNTGIVGSVGTTFGSNPTSSITSIGNGWYRCSMIFTAAATASSGFGIAIVSSNSATRIEANTLSTSVFIWGAQLESGAYPTSYIPTSSASVTRNTDTFQLPNIFTNNIVSSAGGAWFIDLRNNLILGRDAFSNGIQLSGSTNLFQIRNTSGGRLTILKVIGGTSTTLYVTTTDTAKIAIKWNGATADVFVNGVKQVSATVFTETTIQTLDCLAADVPKYINSMALYNTPISDAECIQITTL